MTTCHQLEESSNLLSFEFHFARNYYVNVSVKLAIIIYKFYATASTWENVVILKFFPLEMQNNIYLLYFQ